jgi:hypothetical protein|tara:strand:- start:10344 stop:11162 length:819 start_codon:yes stop_codon:yes gene_type:complete
MQPVIIFTYNRPDHLFKSIKSLKKNNSFSKIKFFIIQDKLKNFYSIIVDKYKQLYKKLISNIKVIKRTYNYGLKKNIIEEVSLILKKHKKVIVCEDDLIFHKDFLNYMNFMLEKYSKDKRISSVSGFSYVQKNQFNLFSDEYLLTLTSSWGWAIKREHCKDFLNLCSNKYKKILFKDKKLQHSFNYDDAHSHTLWLKKNSLKKISSWNIEWEFYNFIKKYYTLYPNFKFEMNKIKIDKISENLSFRNAIKKNIQDNFVKKIVYYNYTWQTYG